MLNEIERFAREGFAIHWLHPESKRPIGDDWSTKPVASVQQLRDTYRKGNNVGVRLGDWSKVSGLYLHVIDMDIQNVEAAIAAKAKLVEMFPDYKTYPTVQSGSGGESRHFYILSDKAYPSKKLAHAIDFTLVFDKERNKEVKKWDWEIELFGTGKQVAMPPSIHPNTGKPYCWLTPFDFDDVDLGLGPIVDSEHLAFLTGDNRELVEEDDERLAPIGLSLVEMQDILDDLPKEYWRDDRDGWLSVGFALHHETDGSDQGFKLWYDFSKDSEKFDKSDQKRVWKSFGRSTSRKPLRMATLMNAAKEARLLDDLDDLDDDLDISGKKISSDGESLDEDFDDILGPQDTARAKKLKAAEVEADLGNVPPKVKRLNRKHAVAFVKGKTVIITEELDGATSYGSPADLHQWYENDRVATEKATEAVTKAWMRHKKRREYPNGIVFAPGLTKEGCFNHWKGWSVIPDPDASCAMWLDHLKMVICSGDEVAYRYALGWFAHMVQKPFEKPGVAMVLRGKKRIGKDTIMDYFGGVCAHHHIKIANQDQLTGKFNAHQEKCLILHVEEGFWAGSKQAEGALKHLITSDKVFIEPKGLNGFHVDSYLRLFISSNEEWVVPATADEGRYFVLDVSVHRKNDHAYFAKMRKEMINGGRAALLHYLSNYDISDFQVRNVPSTAALGQQKVQGLRNVEKFWFDILDSGEMPCEAVPAHPATGTWLQNAMHVDRHEFYNAYVKWHQARRFDGALVNSANVGRHLKEMLAGELETVQPRRDGKRSRAYLFPQLSDGRKRFETYLRSTVEWDVSLAELSEPDDEDVDF